MANKDDYLTEYRQFFEEFANTVEPNDQLPVKLGSYKFINSEVVGGIIDWCLQYLNRKLCPSTLVGPIIKITIEEIRIACKKHPIACGFNPSENVYEPLKLMQTVMSKVNEICLRYLDNSQLDTLPSPPTVAPPKVSVCASRNTRRRMEDKHIVIHDLNSMFNVQDSSPTSYYAIFDGHAGQDAAAYSAAHLHQFLVESEFYPTDPERALREAFLRTDEFFLQKSKIENFRSGTTAVCALLRPKQETLYVAWVGDSQALLVNRGKVLQIVKPHKPSREDEKDRIEANGGCVMFWGMWRVNGQLAVSRAIGDSQLKPYVTADPDVVSVPLDGNEEFLIMACDGLWDFVSEDHAAIAVYNRIKENPENISSIAEHLVDIAKQEGSRDNISVIVIFLKDPTKIKKLNTDWGWSTTNTTMDTDVDNTTSNINNTASNFDLFDVFQKRGTLDPFNSKPEYKSNGADENPSNLYFLERPTNGKRPADEFDDEEDEDFGPETDVDAVDDVLLSPSISAAKSLAEGNGNNNLVADKIDSSDVDMELQRQQSSEFEPLREAREETPTPPADSVLDSSGLADNVAESGEDSEDEWNYYKVDPKQKENTVLPEESSNKVSSDDISQSDAMSQLNPDAKEFIPVSPTRITAASPPTVCPKDLEDDLVITQSPRRAVQMDINVPTPVEFQYEMKQRPSELFDEIGDAANHEQQNGHQLSSQEIMQNLLNGKDVSEIEFHPTNFPKSASDNYIENDVICENKNISNVPEPNVSKETTTSDEQNTESPLSPMGDESDFAAFVPKVQDPMSMSFYQDKDEEGTGLSTNPFDLNKVQIIPDSVDDILESNEEIKQTEDTEKSSSPVVDSLVQESSDTAKSLVGNEFSDKLISSDLSKESALEDVCELTNSPVLEKANSPLLEFAKSPVDDVAKSPVCEISKSPLCEISKSSEFETSKSPICELSKSPIGELSKSPICESSKSPICELSKSPICEMPPSLVCEVPKSPVCEMLSSPICNISKSPVCDLSSSPVCEIPKSPVLEIHSPMELSSPAGPLSPKSPIPELTGLVSPDITASIKDENISGEISETPKTPLHDGLKSPVQEIENGILTDKSPLLNDEILSPEVAKSPVDVSAPSPIVDVNETAQIVEQTMSDLVEQSNVLLHEISDSIQNKIDDAIHDLDAEESKLKDLISDAIEDFITENKLLESDIPEPIIEDKSPLLEDFCGIKKDIEEQISNIVNEANEVTNEAVDVVLEAVDKEMIDIQPEKQINECVLPAKSVESLNVSNVESEAPSEINAFLERSVMPDVTSPLSPTEEIEKFQNERPELWKCVFPLPPEHQTAVEIKCETIQPEFPIHIVTTPSEESKELELDLKPEVIEPVPEKKEVAKTTTKTNKVSSTAARKPLTASKAPVASSTTKPLTSTKTTSLVKKTTTAPTKTTLKPKPSTTPVTSPKTTTTSTSRTTPKTRTPATTPTSKPSDKKPLTNGDVKAPIRQTLVKKTTLSSVTASKSPATGKLSPTKPTAARPASVGTTKLTPGSTATRSTSRPSTTGTTAPKPKPSSLTAKTSSTSTVAATTKSAAPKASPTATKSTTALKPKPAPVTAARPRPTAARPATKAPDTEKQIKETANKQLSAARTFTSRTGATAAKTTTATLKKTDVKPSSMRTTTARTTTTTLKSAGKKPEITRTTITKTKTASKPIVEQNGLVNVIQEITTVSVVSEDPQLLKDNSPIVENSQIPEIIAD